MQAAYCFITKRAKKLLKLLVNFREKPENIFKFICLFIFNCHKNKNVKFRLTSSQGCPTELVEELKPKIYEAFHSIAKSYFEARLHIPLLDAF